MFNKGIKGGLLWGGFMFLFMTFLFPLLDGTEITVKRILIGFPVWLVLGLIMGYFNQKSYKDKQH